jgi:hypothetical protein
MDRTDHSIVKSEKSRATTIVNTDVARMEVQRLIEEVDVQVNRIVSARDYRIFASTAGEILMPLRASLEEELFDKSRRLSAKQICLLSLASARVYDELVC